MYLKCAVIFLLNPFLHTSLIKNKIIHRGTKLNYSISNLNIDVYKKYSHICQWKGIFQTYPKNILLFATEKLLFIIIQKLYLFLPLEMYVPYKLLLHISYLVARYGKCMTSFIISKITLLYCK